MAAATQSAEVEVPRERFPRASLTGFFLGLGPAAAFCVATAAVIAGFAAPMVGGLKGVGVSSPVWIGLLVLGLVPSQQGLAPEPVSPQCVEDPSGGHAVAAGVKGTLADAQGPGLGCGDGS